METVPEAEGRLRAVELANDLNEMAQPARDQFIQAFMTELRERFCLACGSNDPRCQCWNDE